MITTMKKLVTLFVGVFAVFAIAACERDQYEPTVIYDEDEGVFVPEEGAEITIGVDSDTMGLAIIEQWQEDFPEDEYPEKHNMLSFRNYESVNSESSGMEGLELMEDEAPDVALVIDNEVLGRENAVRQFHDYFIWIGEEQTHEIYHQINHLGNFFLPAFYDGMIFSWNRTMLEEWGVDVDDVTEDNLPAELSTWEDIFAYADQYGFDPDERPTFDGRTIREFFPISIVEVWSAYPQITAGDWQIFEEGDYTDPGFDDEEFLVGLELVEEWSQTNMSVDETGSIRSSGEMDWRWERYLEGDYPFGMVGTWMDVKEQMDDTGYDFEFSAIPTYDGNHMSQLIKTKGFVINSATPYPSAANEVLRWLYTDETMATMVNNSTYIPALQDDAEIYPVIEDDFKQDMVAGLEHAWLEPAATLPENPTQRAMSVYYNIGVEDYLMELWDGDRDAAATQQRIHDAAVDWIERNNTRD